MASLLPLLLFALALCSTGCSRAFYRRQADLDAYSLVREKADHPHWRIEDYTIAVDPRSRMYDPYTQDCPPMPPDDPTSHELMHCVDGKRGWPFWHDNGDTPFVENPAWPEFIEVGDGGTIKVSTDDAVRLALLHSRDYQANQEELYLSALDVSFERFRFDSQFFAGYEIFGTFDGVIRGGGESRSTLEANTFSSGPRDFAVTKLFPTGAELVVGFANSLVWQFSGPDDFRGSTLIDFALVQPLLRDAGRDRILESLTVTERNLLANVRAMEQYRQAFYLNITTGRTAGSGPSRAGGTFGTGLENSVSGQAGGFLGLLQTQRQIRNREDNVRRLRRNLARLTVMLEEQPSDQTGAYLNQGLQVAQARQALLSAESSLLTSRNGYEANLDDFKLTLGLPPQVCLKPSDTTLDQFELIDPDIIRLLEDWEVVLANHTPVRREIPQRITEAITVEQVPGGQPICRLPAYEQLADDLRQLRPALASMQQFVDQIVAEHLPAIQRDIERFEAAVPRRKAWVEKLKTRIAELGQSPCELLPLESDPLDVLGTGAELDARLDESLANVRSSYKILSENFTLYANTLAKRGQLIDDMLDNPPETDEARFEQLVRGVFNPNFVCGTTRVLNLDVVEDVTRELIELQLLQANARVEAIELQDIDIRATQALEVARRYRLDWMNARSTLVDRWRLIQFTSDQLQSGLNIFFSGDIGNRSDNPFSLSGDNGRLRVGAQFDAPLTRLVERNDYRTALIDYQQARRSYYAFEDSVGRQLRGELRTITSNQINFELQRMAVKVSAQQVMLNTFIDQEEQRTFTTRVTAARDAVQALNDLLNAQNDFMNIWVSYEVLRRSLDLDLGTMQLDGQGLWIDPGAIRQDYGQVDPWLRQAYANGADGSGTMLPGFDPNCLPGMPRPGTDGSEQLPRPTPTPALPDAALPVPQPAERDPLLDLPPPHLLPPAAEPPPATETPPVESPLVPEVPTDSFDLPLIPPAERPVER